eukprot:3428893-Amphidinium_carterae.1
MALRSTATKEEIDEQSNPFMLALQSTALSSTATKEEIDEQSNPFMLALQSTALSSTATKEEIHERFSQLRLEKDDATTERLSSVPRTLDAAVKDA